MADEVVETPAVKPGWKTTEFWLTAAANLVGMLMASGVLNIIPGNIDDQLVGMIAMVLTTMGYQINRAIVKKNA